MPHDACDDGNDAQCEAAKLAPGGCWHVTLGLKPCEHIRGGMREQSKAVNEQQRGMCRLETSAYAASAAKESDASGETRVKAGAHERGLCRSRSSLRTSTRPMPSLASV